MSYQVLFTIFAALFTTKITVFVINGNVFNNMLITDTLIIYFLIDNGPIVNKPFERCY